MSKLTSEMTEKERLARNEAERARNLAKRTLRIKTREFPSFKFLGKIIQLPQGFVIGDYVNYEQTISSIEEGGKKLEQWLKNPTPQNWQKIFPKTGGGSVFGYQLRNYLLGSKTIHGGSGMDLKGLELVTKILDKVGVKKLLKKDQIEKINKLTTGGKGESLRSIGSKTMGGIKFSMEEVKETIKTHQYGEKWLKANPDSTKIGANGKNLWREYANAIRGMSREQAKLGGFPYGTNSSRKLWANLYRASYRGDRIKLLGEFADGKLPIGENGKVNWNLKNKAGVPAWQRVQFKDLESPKKSVFKWNSKLPLGGLQEQIDTSLGKGKFVRSTRAYDTGVWLGEEKLGGTRSVKDIFREGLLRNELLMKPLVDAQGRRTIWKDQMKPTEPEYKKYLKSKSKRFSLTEVHHPYGIGADPYTSESAFRYANRELGRLEQSFERGKISRGQYINEINRINEEVGGIRTKVGSTFQGARATSAKQVFEEALKHVGKENVSKLRSLYVAAAKTNKGGVCNIFRAEGGRIGFAAGSSCVRQMETAFDSNPVKLSQDITRLEGATPVLGKIKNVARGFLGALGKWGPKVGKFGALAAVGAVAQPLVKQFMNDDPSTYLTDPDQQAGMLEALIEGERPKPRSEILDWGTTAGMVGATAAAVPGTGALWKARRAKGMGVPRASLGPVGKFIAGAYTPAGLLAHEPLRIAQMRREGESWGEVAKSPTLWMGPAFADTMTRMATRGMRAGSPLARGLSLGMSRPMLKTISRRFGMPGLALSLGLSGYDKYKDWKNKRGWFAKDEE